MISCSAGDDRWACTVTNGSHEARADTTPEKGGAGAGFRPHELLEAALASCLNMSVRMAAVDADVGLADVTTIVDVRREADETVFEYAIELDGVTDREAEIVRSAVATCPVHETLTKDLGFENVSEDCVDGL